MTTVGQAVATRPPGACPPIATALRSMGSARAFGKNHLGTAPTSFLPTVHGFDEFLGTSSIHLDSTEDPFPPKLSA